MTQTTKEKLVLGVQTPILYISGGENAYAGGGLISLADTDESKIKISGYNITGNVDITFYKANQETVFNYLTHDKDGKQSIAPDPGGLAVLGSTSLVINTNGGSEILLPDSESNIWFVRVKYEKVVADSLVIKSSFGVLSKQADNELIFWGQNFRSGRSISAGQVKLISFLNSRRDIATTSFGSDGIAKIAVNKEADIALVTVGNSFSIVPLNLRYLNIGYTYSPFVPKSVESKFFTYTDRPLYRPGDKVYFKSVIRNDDDARYSIPTGTALVKFFDGSSDKPFIEKTLSITSDGTVFGEVQLADNARTGYYSLTITRPGGDQSYSSFQVEFFRKPEYSINVSLPDTEYIAGDKPMVEISGNFFSGQPLTEGEVAYKVFSGNYYDYDYQTENRSELDDSYRWGFWGGDQIEVGTLYFNNSGKIDFSLDTLKKHDGHNKVYSFEASYDNGSGNPSFSRKNFLVYAGEFSLFRRDGPYSTKINIPVDLPVILVPNIKTKVSGVKLTAKITREEWIRLDDPNYKYGRYEKIEEDMGSDSATTDKNGHASFSLTPAKSGHFRYLVTAIDQRGNSVIKEFGIFVTDRDYAYYSGSENNDLVITLDKNSYLPNETPKLSIASAIPDRDVLLSLERGRLNRFQILHLNGKSAQIDLPLEDTDIPNIYAVVSSFSQNWLNTNTANIVISREHKRLKVKITPDKTVYGPSDTVNLKVETSDNQGIPISADLGIWSVDKALFELADNRTPDIFNTFWSERWNATQTAHSLEGIFSRGGAERGGCFVTGTDIVMANGKNKSIEDIKPGDFILTRDENNSKKVIGKVTDVHHSTSDGYLIINGSLKITPNHILRLNDTWQEASYIKIGDRLINGNGESVAVNSVEWFGQKADVYNLTVDKYHTFIADGVWVHNDKGERTVFKDTAYWNPAFHTDVTGKGQITFKLPDNLTTWVVAAVADTTDTKVGQTTAEILVSKDVIIRPTLPNILRVDDQIKLSALVQNYTSIDHKFAVNLKFDSGTVANPNQTVTIKSGQSGTVYFDITATSENGQSKLDFSATAEDEPAATDSIVQTIPVRAFGFTSQAGFAGNGNSSFDLKISQDIDLEKSSALLYLTSTILGTLPSAMNYLIEYPYGCVEQTTSRLISAVIAKLHKDVFEQALENKKVDEIIDKAILRLGQLQQSDGGWSWWWSGRSDLFITSYVVEYLSLAKASGSRVPEELLQRAKNYLENFQSASADESVAKAYGLSQFGVKSTLSTDFIQDPYILTLAVLANVKNGDKDSTSNGLEKLLSLSKPQGESLYWEAGSKSHFSSIESATALAIRAIIVGGGDRANAVKAANFLMNNRKSEYWSNTFGTAQVIRAITDLSASGEETSPSYNFVVDQDGKRIKSGHVSDISKSLKPISLPLSQIKNGKSNINISKDGDGQLYSSLVVKQFHTDKNAKGVNNGLKVTRRYQNENGATAFSVGDTITVVIGVDGLSTPENYAVIEDSLPAGMIPINTGFKNEQASADNSSYYSSFGVSDRDYTENGIVMSLYQMKSGYNEYSYQARAVSAGTFNTPPATAALMYSPEINGYSATQKVKIDSLSTQPKIETKAEQTNLTLLSLVVTGLVVIIGLIIYTKKTIPPVPK